MERKRETQRKKSDIHREVEIERDRKRTPLQDKKRWREKHRERRMIDIKS